MNSDGPTNPAGRSSRAETGRSITAEEAVQAVQVFLASRRTHFGFLIAALIIVTLAAGYAFIEKAKAENRIQLEAERIQELEAQVSRLSQSNDRFFAPADANAPVRPQAPTDRLPVPGKL